MPLQHPEKGIGKAEVSLHEFCRIPGSVDPGGMDDKITVGTEPVKLFGRVFPVIFENAADGESGSGFVSPVSERPEIFAQVSAQKSFGTCYQYVQCCITSGVNDMREAIQFFPHIVRCHQLVNHALDIKQAGVV